MPIAEEYVHNKVEISIDGELVDVMECQLMFVREGNQALTVLYHKGRRVIKEWGVEVDSHRKADKHGSSG